MTKACRLFTFLLLVLILAAPSAPSAPAAAAAPAATRDKLFCEKYFEFLDAKNPRARLKVFRDYDLVNWDQKSKLVIDAAMKRLVAKAPRFVENACAGNKITLVLQRRAQANEYMDTQYRIISAFADCLSAGDTETALAHELTHIIDSERDLSLSEEWNRIARNKIEGLTWCSCTSLMSDSSRELEAQAEKRHLPSAYSAANSTELLAEYAAEHIVHKFKLPADVSSFVNRYVMTCSDDALRDLVRDAHCAAARGDNAGAIALATQSLRARKGATYPHLLLGFIWNILEEEDLAAYESRIGWQSAVAHGYAKRSEQLANAQSFVFSNQLQRKDLIEAANSYAALNRFSDPYSWRYDIIGAYSSRDLQALEAYAEAGRRRFPQDGWPWFFKAEACRWDPGRRHQAIDAYERAAKNLRMSEPALFSPWQDARLFESELLIESGKLEQASTLLTEFQQQHKANPWAVALQKIASRRATPARIECPGVGTKLIERHENAWTLRFAANMSGPLAAIDETFDYATVHLMPGVGAIAIEFTDDFQLRLVPNGPGQWRVFLRSFNSTNPLHSFVQWDELHMTAVTLRGDRAHFKR